MKNRGRGYTINIPEQGIWNGKEIRDYRRREESLMDLEKNTEKKSCSGCLKRTKKRTSQEQKSMINRLNRIEGQIRGIRKMVENDAYCPDILIQVSAVNAALNSFNKVLLAEHIRTCVAGDIREGKDETIDELMTVLQKLMK